MEVGTEVGVEVAVIVNVGVFVKVGVDVTVSVGVFVKVGVNVHAGMAVAEVSTVAMDEDISSGEVAVARIPLVIGKLQPVNNVIKGKKNSKTCFKIMGFISASFLFF